MGPVRLFLLAAACAGCARGAPPESAGLRAGALPAPDLGPVVARVGAIPIHAEEVAAQARKTGRSSREAVDQLVAYHLLAERAREHGLAAAAPAPEHLVQRLVERDFLSRTRVEDLPEAELRRVYERVKTRYVHPRLVEALVVSIYTGPAMKPEPRARMKATAEAFAAHLRAHPPAGPDELRALVASPEWAERKVTVLRRWQSLDQPFSARVGTALHRLSKVGQLTPLVEDDYGHHLAMYLDEKAPKDVPFEEARAELAREYHPLWQAERWKQFGDELVSKRRVEIFRERVLASGR
jgi:hypothetical protein